MEESNFFRRVAATVQAPFKSFRKRAPLLSFVAGRIVTMVVLLFLLVLSAFIGLTVRMVMIVRADGEKYKKQVLSQQSYDSRTIPFRSSLTRLEVEESSKVSREL